MTCFGSDDGGVSDYGYDIGGVIGCGTDAGVASVSVSEIVVNVVRVNVNVSGCCVGGFVPLLQPWPPSSG